MGTLLQDLRYGLRMLAKNPGFTAVAVITLALGIGANTTVFSLVNAMLLRVLPVERPHELVLLNTVDERGGGLGFSYPLFEALRDHNHTLAGIFTWASGPMNVGVEGYAELAPGGGQFVSGSFFSTLGVSAVAGRTITAEDDKVPGKHPVALLSYGYWKRRFGSDPSAVGKTIHLNGYPFTVIGVTQPRFYGISLGSTPDVFVPMMMYPEINQGGPSLNDRGSWRYGAMARLKPGVDASRAKADLNVTLQQYVAEGNSSGGKEQRGRGLRIELEPGAWGLSPRSKPAAWAGLGILMGMVGLVLLTTCANIANLLLARGEARQKEIAVRLSVGAGRLRLIRQLLTESLLLAVFGGAAGLFLALWGTEGLAKLVAQGAGRALDLSPDARVLWFSAAISLLAELLFGLAPAIRVTRTDLTTAIKEGRPQWGSAPMRNRLRSALVVSQVALSLVLLVLAALFNRSFEKLVSVDLGFRPEHVLLLSVDPTLIGDQGVRINTLYKSLLEKLETAPGVLSASASRSGLLERGSWGHLVTVPGYTPHPGEQIGVNFNPVGSHFFETTGIPIVLGRDFLPQDNESAPKVAAVNETFARRFFGGTSPLGRTIGLGVNENLGQFEIIGVVKDSKQRQVVENPLPVVYFPFLQLPPSLVGQMTLEVRTAADPAAMAASVRKELLAVEKNLPIFGVKTLTQQVEDSLFEQRMLAGLSRLFGLLALLLASVGLYGVLSYSVARRTTEIGIRMALGAQRGDVTRLVLRDAMAPVLVGSTFGLAGGLGAGRVVSSFLFGLAPTDPVSFVAAAIMLAGVAALASYIPARRATKVDPVVALRYE